jgi:type IV secretory pathway VirJ component
MCHGNGLEWTGPLKGKGYIFSPVKEVSAPWIVFQGTADQVCDTPATQEFVKMVKNAEIVVLPKVGHGFSVPRNWQPQYQSVFERLFKKRSTAAGLPSSVSDLPLIELPATGKQGNRMAVIVSGDGGWAGIDKELGGIFSTEGIPVTGLNSLKYFWDRRSPESCARDLERIIGHYRKVWSKEEVVLFGYSFGADVLPFMVNRLSPESLKHVAGIALISPSHSASFEFHVSDWLSDSSDPASVPVLPELEKMKGHKVLCMAGSDEPDSLCKDLKLVWVKNVIVPGGHHLGGDYSRIARTILGYIGPDVR